MAAKIGIMTRHRTGSGQLEGNRAVVSQICGSFIRAFLVALLIATPALMLPWVAADTAQIVVVIALLFSLLTFIEYFGRYPSFVEFRFAAPYNRLKFIAVFIVVMMLSLIARGQTSPNTLSSMLSFIGQFMGNTLDFPFSPVRLIVLMMPPDATEQLTNSVRVAAGISYSVSLITVITFIVFVKMFGWPMRNGAFNVWVNLPLFDPTRGGDIVDRLRRDSGLNIVLGVLLPFMIPAIVKAASMIIEPVTIESPQTLIWLMTVWAILPASILMRGIALMRVAELIEEKRRRVYAKAAAESMQEA
ncbi:MAG: hypothetical protein AAFQ04_07265 [Pseudomonadota bacterium]